MASAAVGTGLANYDIQYVDGTLSVGLRTLTISANDRSKTYGSTVTFAGTEFSQVGLTGTDTLTAVTLTSTGAAAGAAIGDYPIVASAAVGTGLANYDIQYVDGTLSVGLRTLTISANDRSKTYGSTVTFAGTEFSQVGLTGTDTLTAVTLTSTGAAAGAAIGDYPIVASAAVGTGLANYDIQYVDGTLSVGLRTLTISANDRSKTYGSTVTFAGTEFSQVGLTGTDTLTAVTLTSTGAAAGAAIGDYPIVASAAVGTGLANYDIQYVDGTLSVGLRTLTISANDRSKTYGSTVTFAGTEFSQVGLTGTDT